MSLKAKFMLIFAAMLVTTIGIASLAIFAVGRFNAEISEAATITTALRNHTVGDMLHDGLRADVYAAFFAAQNHPDEKHQLAAEQAEHAAQFRQLIKANKALPLPESVRSALRVVDQPLTEYIEAAEQIAALSFTDYDAAVAGLPEFDKRFAGLEVSMETAGNRIESAAVDVGSESVRFGKLARIGGWTALSLALGMSIVASWFVLRVVIEPLVNMEKAMRMLAANDLDVSIPLLDRIDEIGAMARAVQIFKENAIRVGELTQARETERAQSEKHLRDEMMKLANALDAEVQTKIASIVEQANTVKTSSHEMSKMAEQVRQQTSSVAETADSTKVKVDAVASGAHDLMGTITMITEKVGRSTEIATAAVRQAQDTNTTVEQLSTAAEKIGQVVDLISEIAERTNLLALNATIELARAGESGKGFAVVASEVKSLATQTANATQEISQQVHAIQQVSKSALTAIESITGTITQINDITSEIAGAVSQQETATREIADNVEETVHFTEDVATNIEDAHSASEGSGKLSAELMRAAVQMATDIEQLQSRLVKILRESIAGNRRSDERFTNAGAAVTAVVDGREIRCGLVNASPSGLCIQGAGRLGVGTTVAIDIPTVGKVQATVIWSDHTQTGLKFKERQPKILELSRKTEEAA